MKTKLRKLLPVIVMAIAAAGAFSTHAMDQKAKLDDLVSGYIKIDPEGMSCRATLTVCTTVQKPVQCTVGHDPSGDPLFLIESDGSCARPLYKPSSY